MNENEKWLSEHSFVYDAINGQWRRDLDVIGNFKNPQEEFDIIAKINGFSQRKIQNVAIVVTDNLTRAIPGGLPAWSADIEVVNGHDLNKSGEPVFASARNETSVLCDTPQEAIKYASDNLCGKLISCLKQVAKLASKTLEISFK